MVPNGVPLPDPVEPRRRAELRRSLGLGEGTVAALFAGQLEPRKDPLGAIAATEAARRGGADLVLLLAGSGPLAEEAAARAGAGVRVLGQREDLEDLYAAADLFLLPSHREGMSFALLEAMAHGLAPVVADGPGNRETVADAGAVFAAGDRGAMADRLAALAADAAERARLGAAARERIRDELGVERFREGTREQYEAALGGASGASERLTAAPAQLPFEAGRQHVGERRAQQPGGAAQAAATAQRPRRGSPAPRRAGRARRGRRRSRHPSPGCRAPRRSSPAGGARRSAARGRTRSRSGSAGHSRRSPGRPRGGRRSSRWESG